MFFNNIRLKIAIVLAYVAHFSVWHKRKYTGEFYVTHLREVAELVERFGGTPDMIAAAWLHDTLEDTWVKMWMLRLLVGDNIAEMVYLLTDDKALFKLRRRERKAIRRTELALVDVEVKIIKVCDMYSNALSIKEHDKKFYKTYRQECLDLNEAMNVVEHCNEVNRFDPFISVMLEWLLDDSLKDIGYLTEL